MNERTRIAIVHPWFPQYRERFFELLVERGREENIDIDVYYGQPPPEWAARGDAVAEKSYAVELPTRAFRVGRRSLLVKSLRPLRKRGPYRLVVLEHAVRNLETLAFIATHRRRQIAFWGHGRSYTSSSGRAQEWFKGAINRRASWFFAYTSGGRLAVARTGFPMERITEVRNSIDTALLREDLSLLSEFDRAEFASAHSLHDCNALYIGGLDTSKRLDFLISSAAGVARDIPEFRLLIAGNGDMADLIRAWAEELPWLIYLGPVKGKQKALALNAAHCIAMPGRVGLVAVDSLTAGRPIVTTGWPWHAPEFEYLENGRTCLVTDDDQDSYRRGLTRLLLDRHSLQTMSEACRLESPKYTIESMTENFLAGLKAALRLQSDYD